MALTAAHLDTGVILVVTVWRQVYNLPLPPPPFSPFLTSLMVSVDVKHHVSFKCTVRAQELCECRGGRPGLSFPNNPYGECGRKATLDLILHHRDQEPCSNIELDLVSHRAQELCGSLGDRPGLPVPNSPYGPCGRKATFKRDR